MKKTCSMLSVLLVGLMLLSLLSGCGNGTSSSTQQESLSTKDATSANSSEEAEPSEEGEATTIQFWYQGTSQEDLDFVQKCISSFNEKYPNITVEATGMTAVISEQETKLNAGVLSDTYPDVIAIVLAQVGSRGSLGDFENLQPYINEWTEKDDLFDSAYEMGKYQGEQVALGLFPNPQIYTYRKDSFIEAGLDPENPPSTWEELKEAAEKLTKREGDKVVFAGLDVPSIDSSLVFTEPYMRSAGSAVIDEINLKPAFTDDAAIEAMDFISELAQLNISIPHDQQKGDERPFMNGMAAISNLSLSQIIQFKDNNPDIELGYFPVLSKDGDTPGTAFCGYQLIAMSAASKHKEEAWLFIEHMLSNEVVWDRTETFNQPIVKKSLEEQYINSGDSVLNAAVLEYVDNGKGKATVPWISVFNKYVSVAYEEVINDKKTPEQALADAEAALLKEIE